MKRKKIASAIAAYILASLIILAVYFPKQTSAQQISLAISPPLIELIIKPGKSVLYAYKLENHGDPVIIKSFVLPFKAGDNLGNIAIKPEFDGPIRFNLDNSELQLDQPYFLKSNDSQQLLLRIRVPEGAPEGDYYYTFLSETQPPPIQEGISSGRAKARIGSNLLITVTNSGNIDLKGRIAIFDVLAKYKIKIFNHTYNFFESSDKIPVVLIVNNKGKNLIKPQGEINLTGNFGEKANFEIVPQNVLAESQRQLFATPSAGFNSAKPTTLLLSGFFIGNYKLSTAINFGTNTTRLYSTTSFIALPIKFACLVIISLSVIILLIRIIRKPESDPDI